jgi:hypothetical protein
MNMEGNGHSNADVRSHQYDGELNNNIFVVSNSLPLQGKTRRENAGENTSHFNQ